MPSPFKTHDVANQSPPFENINLFATDRALRTAVTRDTTQKDLDGLLAFGALCGSSESVERARFANENPPRLRTFDAKGNRRDVVEFHPAYHELMAISCREGLHARTWDHLAAPEGTPAPGATLVRAAGLYLAAQMEPGHCCPITMTHACVPTLLLQPELARDWIPRILSRHYDPALKSPAQKAGVTVGMGMTEKQGGTDVRTNTSRAEPLTGRVGPGALYAITGHKWFMSAPMSDAFLVLAQAKGGLSCFLMPRVLPDGSINALHFQRLKDKLGNRSNASSEVEFHEAQAWLIGEEGRGIPAIIEMVTRTRLDCALSSAGLMRQALANAIHHTRYRTVFQRKLVDHALMTEVLADMALDVEAATALVFHLARMFDRPDDPACAAWARLMTPVVKYWICKLAPPLAYEAMECLGGNGYVEEGIAARIYREVPVNAIWEGSGNVMALDVLRVLQREAQAVEIVLDDLAGRIGDDAGLNVGLDRIQALLQDPRNLDRQARTLVELLATVAAGALLQANAPSFVANAFVGSRLAGRPRQSYGQGLERADARAIVDRALEPAD